MRLEPLTDEGAGSRLGLRLDPLKADPGVLRVHIALRDTEVVGSDLHARADMKDPFRTPRLRRFVLVGQVEKDELGILRILLEEHVVDPGEIGDCALDGRVRVQRTEVHGGGRLPPPPANGSARGYVGGRGYHVRRLLPAAAGGGDGEAGSADAGGSDQSSAGDALLLQAFPVALP